MVFDFEGNSTIYNIGVLARDSRGAEQAGVFEVTILDLDDEKPVLQLNGDANLTHEAGDVYVDANAKLDGPRGW